MPSKTDATVAYKQLMDRTGFYRNGKPTPGIIEADSLLSNNQIDKKIKYSAVIDPKKLGATAIFELSESPCIYFKHLDQSIPDPSELKRLHELAWNHGLAPMLWVVTPSQVLLYNCYSQPLQNEPTPDRHLIRLFQITEEGLRQLNEFAGRFQIESGKFWQQQKAHEIDRRRRVDATLLENLKEAENRLVQDGLPRRVVHRLLGRSIFVAYLSDRGILKPEFLRDCFNAEKFTDVLTNKSDTYNLFEWVQATFNGDLFPLTHRHALEEQRLVKPNHLEQVQDLLNGTKIKTGQRRLWPYNFDVIPVELISSIYEQFAHTGDPQAAQAYSTHYTPVNLVDLVLSQVFYDLPGDANVLDLACGSGVFLVESLRRLVAHRIANGEDWTRALVRNTLHNQIYGVDINPEAVQIAAFSLYLTALELDPDPQPPEALAFEPLIGRNLFVADAFDEEAEFNKQEPFAAKNFGAIVGNPPWKKQNAPDSLATQYCKRHGYPLANDNPPDQAFLWRVGDFTNDEILIGLIMHAKPFFSHTSAAVRAKEALLSRFKPRMMVNLSDLRMDRLFPTSTAPAMVLIAKGRHPEPNDSFSFVCTEHSEAFKRHGIIEIGAENIKRLPVYRAASDPDVLKVASWGSARDMALIRRLRESFPSLEAFSNEHGWKKGQGYQRAGGQKRIPELCGKTWLKSGELTPFLIETERLEKLPRTATFLFPRSPDIYKGPLVVAVRGIRQEGFGAAFSEEDIFYSEEYYGFAIPHSDIHLAHYLNVILNSSLAGYYLFLTGSVWGIERDKVEPNDLLRLPIPIPTEDREKVIVSMLAVEKQLRDSPNATAQMELRRRLDEAVFDLYNLDEAERVLVQDTVNLTIDLRMKREKSEALKPPQPSELEAYARQLIGVIQPFLGTLNERAIVAEVLDVGQAPLRAVRFSMVSIPGRKPPVQTVPAQDLETILRQIARRLPHQIADRVYTRRNLRIYTGKDLYIVKPAQRRYWSRSAGLNDADAILAEHLGGNREPFE